MGIQRREALEAGDRHQEVPAAIADQALDLTLVVALAGPPEAIGEEVVGLQLAEHRVRRRVPSPGCGPRPAWCCRREPSAQRRRRRRRPPHRSEEHTSELQSLVRTSYAVL